MWLGRLDIYCLKSKDRPFDNPVSKREGLPRSQLCFLYVFPCCRSPIRRSGWGLPGRFTEGVSESQRWHCGPQRSEPFGCDGGGTSVGDGGFIGVKVM